MHGLLRSLNAPSLLLLRLLLLWLQTLCVPQRLLLLLLLRRRRLHRQRSSQELLHLIFRVTPQHCKPWEHELTQAPPG
jgi:hypothetical protein